MRQEAVAALRRGGEVGWPTRRVSDRRRERGAIEAELQRYDGIVVCRRTPAGASVQHDRRVGEDECRRGSARSLSRCGATTSSSATSTPGSPIASVLAQWQLRRSAGTDVQDDLLAVLEAFIEQLLSASSSASGGVQEHRSTLA